MENGLTYTKVGDYYIPNLTLGDQPDKPIGLYGRMRRTYLQKHRPGVFNNMVLNGTLYSHLVEVDEAAQHRLDVLMPQLARAAGATEELKAHDQMVCLLLGLQYNLLAQTKGNQMPSHGCPVRVHVPKR